MSSVTQNFTLGLRHHAANGCFPVAGIQPCANHRPGVDSAMLLPGPRLIHARILLAQVNAIAAAGLCQRNVVAG